MSQNAADDASPLQCSPECPPPPESDPEQDQADEAASQARLQELFDFYEQRRQQRKQANGSGNRDNQNNLGGARQVAYDEGNQAGPRGQGFASRNNQAYDETAAAPAASSFSSDSSDNHRDDAYSVRNPGPEEVGVHHAAADFEHVEAPSTAECPGGDLDTCIDVCPGTHPKAFAICVAECGSRCP